MRTADGVETFPRGDLMSMIFEVRGRGNWSGRVRIGGTRRAGNTDQTDLSVHFDTTRRTANSRTSLTADSVFSEVRDTRTTDGDDGAFGGLVAMSGGRCWRSGMPCGSDAEAWSCCTRCGADGFCE